MVVGWADGFAQSENQMVKVSSPVRRSFSSRRWFWKTLEDCKINADWLGHAWSFLSHWIIEASSIGLGLKAVQIWKGLWYYLVLLGHYMAHHDTILQFFDVFCFIAGSVCNIKVLLILPWVGAFWTFHLASKAGKSVRRVHFALAEQLVTPGWSTIVLQSYSSVHRSPGVARFCLCRKSMISGIVGHFLLPWWRSWFNLIQNIQTGSPGLFTYM